MDWCHFLTFESVHHETFSRGRWWSYPPIQRLNLVLVEPILYQNYERRSMWSFDQAKIALTLVQEWPKKNEVIDLCNKRNWKN
jgi:hypothetical protein